MLKLDIIAGARPNFMKIAPVIHEIERVAKDEIVYRLIHTGQHFDHKMSQAFFEDLNIPHPHLNLGAGGGTQAEQTAAVMIGYERALAEQKPDMCLVVGDVTSTLACSIAAKKAGVRVAHIEGGIRSGDLMMPEEINRLVTDSISDIFFTTSETANKNLRKAGVEEERIHFVGNTMIDTLYANLDRLRKPDFFEKLKLGKANYFVLTLHRPANVDHVETLLSFLTTINDGADGNKVIFPIHPRTKGILKDQVYSTPNIHFVEPLSYLEFIYLVKNAKGVITDSGGITEESTVLGIPCITLRENTERPETVAVGTNVLVGTKPENIPGYIQQINKGLWKKGAIPDFWDGETSKRIIACLQKL